MIENLQELSIEERTDLFSKYFSLGQYSSNDGSIKLELINLICFVTFELKKRNPNKFKCTQDFLVEFIEKLPIKDSDRYGRFLIGLCIICDDILSVVDTYKNNTGYTSFQDAVKRIKNILDEWMPF